nr:PREDICTED: bifunctional ATP-dependent dihydroxyacetone kinase/FAD-AMP lyase (cyclizing)-like isoform X1 [Megachile rotundata]XP_012137738.1 PREDICTED: bifunctional ATP-dependent dihydroxyacetone kinase/FAD-AMP lyase (cyclizing)-like isoform X1 [Megachile rotundata]
MSTIIHDYANEIIEKSLLGLTKLHSGLSVLEHYNAILRADYVNMVGKVKLISGGKAENELTYTGFVGPGMLTAAILGNTFCAPPVNDILKVIEEVGFDHTTGILLIIQNYAEYIINFTSAKLRAEAKGYNVKIITINNTSHYSESITEEQNLLPLTFIYKIAGAMSEEGKDINEIYFLCNSIASSGEIVSLKAEYKNTLSEKHEIEAFSNLAKQALKPIMNVLNLESDQSNTYTYGTKTFHTGHEVAILINNFGCNQVETNIFILELLKQIEKCGLKMKRIYMKSLVTENIGFHVCLLNLSFTTILIKYLDHPSYAPAWPKVLTFEIMNIKNDDTAQLITSKRHSKNITPYDTNIHGPIFSYKTSQVFLSIISMACEAIIACTKQLNKMDEQFGNGNCGTSLARGANAVQQAIQQKKILGTNVYAAFTQISQIIERTVGGSQGGLYSLLFYNVAKTFSEYDSDKEVTADMWLHALNKANETIKQLGIFSINDQVLLTVLTTMEKDLRNGLNTNMDPIDAFAMIVKTAENFAINTTYTQSLHRGGYEELKYPNPEAHAVGIWMRAAYEVTKLKLNYN